MTTDGPAGAVQPDVTRLLHRYDDLLRAATTDDARVGALRHVPGTRLYLAAHAVRHVDRALSALAGHHRRRHALTGSDADEEAAERLDGFRAGLPDSGPVKTVTLLLVAAFLVLLPLVDRFAGPSVVDIASAAVRLDGAGVTTALRGSDPDALLVGMLPMALLGLALAAPAVIGVVALRRLLGGTGADAADAPSTLALETSTLAAAGLAPPRPAAHDLVFWAVLGVLVVVGLGYLVVDPDTGWQPWMAVFPVLLVAVLVAFAVALSSRHGRRWSARPLAAFTVLGVVAATVGAVQVVDWLALREQPAFDFEAAEIAEHGVLLADFLDQSGLGADEPVPPHLNLEAYQQHRGRPADDATLRRLPGLVVSWQAISYGALFCDCALLTKVLDARTMQPLPGDWYATRWPITYREAADDVAQGDIWVLQPDAPGDYLVQLTIARTAVASDLSEVPDNREVDGPFELVLRTGETVGEPVYQQFVRLTGMQTDVFPVPLAQP